MGHDELLARIKAYELDSWTGVPEDRDELATALRAVVELHKPVEYATGASTAIGNPAYLPTETACSCSKAFTDYDKVPYPCPTTQAIEKELK